MFMLFLADFSKARNIYFRAMKHLFSSHGNRMTKAGKSYDQDTKKMQNYHKEDKSKLSTYPPNDKSERL